jgi:allophanate hydrolase subunit 1
MSANPSEYLRARVGGSQKLYLSFVDTFKCRYQTNLMDMKQAIKNKRVNKLSESALKYKDIVINFYPLDHIFIRTLQCLQDTNKVSNSTIQQFKNILAFTVELIEVLRIPV